jgi:carboxypeptidase Taq
MTQPLPPAVLPPAALPPAALPPAYAALHARFAELGALGECGAILSWDQAVIMPAAAAASRGEQFAALAAATHRAATHPAIAELLQAATAESLPPAHATNLRLMQRAYTRSVAVPEALVAARARAQTACETAWREARRASTFRTVAPLLAEVVALTRESAGHLAAATGLAPYDALMDGFQPGLRVARVEPLFAALEAFLPALLAERLERQAQAPLPLRPRGPFPIPAQRQLMQRLAGRTGLDFTSSRLDESTHPFSGGTPEDTRITTRYREEDVTQAILAVLHECGHALYEKGLPEAFRRQPAGEAAGMAVHESQSLIIEMQASRSDEFLGWLGPVLAQELGADPAFAPANLATMWRRVEKGFIRVEADELTYPLHVLLRFRLERALLSGELAAQDLPGAWNEGFAALFGLVPPNDAQGCLQDIHWYDGAFGYFPAYTLGAMAAAQLWQAAVQAVPEIPAQLAEGSFAPLLGWLRSHVHAQGAAGDMDAVLLAATGRKLEVAPFQAHLTARYGNK